MPIYEFECLACGLLFEEILPAHFKQTPHCPACHRKDQVERQMSASARTMSGSQSDCAPKGGFS